MTNRIHAIALHTFKEAIRDRIIVLFVVFALLLMASSTVLSWLTVGSELKIVTDIGLAALALFGAMIAVFIGITLVHKEVEKKTIYSVLAKPVARWEFLVGKYVGLLITLLTVAGLMSAFFLLVVGLKGGAWPGHLVPAIVLTFMEMAVVTAVALVFSSFTSPILAAVFTLAVYAVGHMSWGLRELLMQAPNGAVAWIARLLYFALPDLETFNVRSQVVHGIGIDAAYLADAFAYAAAYSVGMIVLAVILFRNRDLV
jgi:ABC-type transport system involved in multi-copper enzyme maturation permease subunit